MMTIQKAIIQFEQCNIDAKQYIEQSVRIPRSFQLLNSYKKKVSFNQHQLDLITGTLLGDSSLRRFSNKALLSFEQKNVDYLFHLYKIMAEIVRNPPQMRVQQRLPTSELACTFYFSTLTLDSLLKFYDIFYENGRKILPVEYLLKQLTARALAYWFMDDGSKNRYIASCAFSNRENESVAELIERKFGFSCKVVRTGNYPALLLGKEMKDIIAPYVVPSMRYKLN